MPTFDVVSEIDIHELTNAVDQTNREVNTRFDFKDSGAHVEQAESELTLVASSEFQVDQVRDILEKKMTKRGIDIACLEIRPAEMRGKEARQTVIARQGIDKELSRKLVKMIKETKLKVQTSIQGEQLRVSGKKRDDLQQVMSALREKNVGIPLQFQNFRD